MNIETPLKFAPVHRLSTLKSDRPRTILSQLVPGARLSRPNEAAVNRVLIIKLSSIGDIVQAMPVASALKRRFPSVRITWAVEDWAAPLIEHHPAIDRVAIFPRMTSRVQPNRQWMSKFLAGARAIRAEPYDVSIDLQGLLKSAVVAAISRGAIRIGVGGQREGAHLVSAPVPRSASARHAVDEYLDAARYLGAQPPRVEFGLAIDSAATESIARMLSLAGVAPTRPILAVNPSASTSSKSWRAANWIALLRGIDGSIAPVLVGGRENRAKHAAIAGAVRGGDIVDLTGRTTLPELVALLARSALHVAPDTGSLHIAAALGRPVVGIYGPTPPSRLGPYGQPEQAIDHRELCGRWCPRVCVHARRCLRAITPNEVREKIEVALSAESAGSVHAGQ